MVGFSYFKSRYTCFKHRFVSGFFIPIAAPPMVVLKRRTNNSVLITFTDVQEGEGQFVYKVDGGGISTCGNQECQVDGLSAGTAYNFTVKACIQKDPERCGDPSDVIATTTLPNGTFLFYVTHFWAAWKL